MAFARSVDHLDGDEISFADFVAPRPHASMLFRVRDDRLADHAIVAGDVVVVERNHSLRADRLALIRAGGDIRLVSVRQEGPRFTYDGFASEDASVELLGIASRIVRVLLP
jgi:SOS-response transcriptional repressor LexA